MKTHNGEPCLQTIHNVEKTPAKYLSNHVLINRVRLQRGVPKLRRSRYLDSLAQDYVNEAARLRDFSHSQHTIEELRSLLGSERVGQNLCKGQTMIEMHELAMQNGGPTRANILSKNFVEMGMATATSVSGKLYMIQFFRGETEGGPSVRSTCTGHSTGGSSSSTSRS